MPEDRKTRAVEPNITKTKEGNYRARYKDPSGNRRGKTFKRLADARAFLREANARVARSEWTDPTLAKRTFAEAAEIWKSTWVDLKPTTKERYESMLRLYVLPTFGKRPVGSITKASVQAYVRQLTDDPDLAAATVWRIVDVIRGPLRSAVEAEWIPRNPATKLKLPRKATDEMLFLSAEQVRDLAETITPHYRTAIYFAAYTGLRAGEVWGVKVRDIDFLRGVVHVRRALISIGGKPTFDTPKTHEARTVYLPAFIRELVSADLAARFGGSRPPADALVFVTTEGQPVRHTNFMRRHFRPAVVGREARPKRRGTAGSPAIPPALPEELAGLRFHDLRHTAASIAAANGAQPKEVQQMLGHKSIQITYDRYTHLFPDRQEALAERMDAAYRAAAETSTEAEVVELRAAE